MILRQTKYGYNAHHLTVMALNVSQLIDEVEEGGSLALTSKDRHKVVSLRAGQLQSFQFAK